MTDPAQPEPARSEGEAPDAPHTDPGAVPTERPTPGVLARCAAGGALMGLANLVPGISGGTMLVAAGVYERFIDAIGDVTRLRLRFAPIAVLGATGIAAVVAIGALAGVVSEALEGFRWAMYSLFIGLTLGGVPIMLGLVRPMTRAAWAGCVGGLVVMLGLVVVQSLELAAGATSSNPVMLVLAGIAGASAMILPGVSGAYLLLLLGQYEAIIGAIKDLVTAAKDLDLSAALSATGVVIPVGIGVVLGVVVVGNLLKFVLHRYEKATLGVLLGLLIAAPAGLYPFKAGVQPQVGDTVEGQLVTADNLAEFDDPKDWDERFFTPTVGHVGGSLGLIALGFVATWSLGKLGKERSEPASG